MTGAQVTGAQVTGRTGIEQDAAGSGTAAAGAVPALAVEGVGHRFGSRDALLDVSLEVPEGAIVALLGPNGAGKTTFFSVVTRLYHNRTGAVRIFGHDLRREPSRALALMGAVFQSRTLDTDLSVRQNLLYHASLHGIPGREAKRRVDALLDRVGLADRVDDRVRELSGGQSRRVEIARSLVHGPRLLLLDEPTVGLDLESRRAIAGIVRALVAEDGLSVLWATHIFDEVEPSDRVAVLHRGRIIARGRADAVAGPEGSLEDSFRRLTAEPPRRVA